MQLDAPGSITAASVLLQVRLGALGKAGQDRDTSSQVLVVVGMAAGVTWKLGVQLDAPSSNTAASVLLQLSERQDQRPEFLPCVLRRACWAPTLGRG